LCAEIETTDEYWQAKGANAQGNDQWEGGAVTEYIQQYFPSVFQAWVRDRRNDGANPYSCRREEWFQWQNRVYTVNAERAYVSACHALGYRPQGW